MSAIRNWTVIRYIVVVYVILSMCFFAVYDFATTLCAEGVRAAITHVQQMCAEYMELVRQVMSANNAQELLDILG